MSGANWTTAPPSAASAKPSKPSPTSKGIDSLQAARGKGRDDYPVPRLGSIVLLTILLRYHSVEDCLAQLHRNPAWCRLIGTSGENEIPHGWNGSRFLDVLGQQPHLCALCNVFDSLARSLRQALPDLGRHTAGDATGLNGRPKTDAKAVQAEINRACPSRREAKRSTRTMPATSPRSSGAGKSPLVKPLCRLYDPDAGRIEWDGIDLRDLEIAKLLRLIAVDRRSVAAAGPLQRHRRREHRPGEPQHDGPGRGRRGGVRGWGRRADPSSAARI
ncbi:MAG TPA: ATP-binding cassette domain-containing protein [Gemmataceae bacterium]